MSGTWRGEGAPPAGVGLRGKGAADGALSGAPAAAELGEGTADGALSGPSQAGLTGTSAGRNYLKHYR
jgi:hypothetical protein